MKNSSKAIRIITFLSLQHMLVDFICALAMYNTVLNDRSAAGIIYYNMCAFALQMPFGLVADILQQNDRKETPMWFVALAIVFLLAGCLMPSGILLGIGNALFHVGGGILTIEADNDESFAGRGLGCFVAPGAIGLLTGSILKSHVSVIEAVTVALLTILLILIIREKYQPRITAFVPVESSGKLLTVMICCFIVVVLRCYVGLLVKMPWKTTVLRVFISVLALAIGKTAGGFAAARFGMKKTVIVSLLLAGACYMLKDNMIMGVCALFLFNMTMPLTLYMMSEKMPGLPGTAFGILTFALFVGYALYAYVPLSVDGSLLAVAGCLISVVLLLMAEKGCQDE